MRKETGLVEVIRTAKIMETFLRDPDFATMVVMPRGVRKIEAIELTRDWGRQIRDCIV